MAVINVSYHFVTDEILNEYGIDFRTLLKHSQNAKETMDLFHIKDIRTIEKAIKQVGKPIRSYFQFTSWSGNGRNIFVDHGLENRKIKPRSNKVVPQPCEVYICEYQYCLLAWKEVCIALVKKYYPTFYNAFSHTNKVEIDMSAPLSSIMEKFERKSIKEVRTILNHKYYNQEEIKFNIYASSWNREMFYLPIEDGEKSIYLSYEDLYKAKNGNAEQAWEDIVNRVWYQGEKQGITEWFQSSEVTKKLHEVLMNM